MEPIIPGLTPVQVGAVGVVILSLVGTLLWVYRRFVQGDIVTRRESEGLLHGKDEVIALQKETIEVQRAQIERLTVVGDLQVKFFEAIDTVKRSRRST